ncbi:Transposable element Tc1 transposase [Araneus ventricosus]|uniref:Transposable element Tc1 transposase n=1 Tax=Araneus ventricosus TaxID=182803 RepID=A0A4Y2JRR3_ARAVE|nr:Transposable element Tc1 transposase [Araneus ventricosus]GBM91807.1 Transposable element Tc1 transposase [Araneus ventricosus]GBM91846.1 Transposable element Tc1 transposase [Araneus ventricosus]GBM91866.1 Transposable element Tc1 transposase [Araneus ventricosus]GBM91877.1 Transposable element Tc1 transposase [Araneus ventricosus]
MDQWATVLFTDESRFSLNTDSRRTFIWREPGTRYLLSNVREIDNYGGGGLMVLAGILLDGRTPLHVFERGTVTGVRYRDILEPYVRLPRGAVGPEFILMDDNARLHTVLLVDEFKESEDIRRVNWPAKSPDLNSVEHVWDALGWAIATCNPPPRTIQEMKIAALLNEWDQLPQEMINCFISSMKSRCKAYISVRGNNTPH